MQPLLKWIEPATRPGLALALAGFGAFLALWFWAGPALALGDGIEVVEDRSTVDFPDTLSFTLTAQGSQEIVEVQLLFRASGSDVWSYAYPAFEPAQRVTANLDLNIAGASYLPPGTLVDYYYVLTDAQGNVHHTEAKSIEYIDPRFEWDRTQVDSLLLLHHGQSDFRVAAVAKEVEAALAQVRSLLQIEQGRPMRGVIYNSNAEARDAFPHQSQTITDSQVFGGFAFAPNGIFVGIGFRPRIITHESAHILLEQALGPGALPVPAWLNEGFASYVEPGSISFSGQSLGSRGLSLRAMTRVSGTPRDITTFYRKAESVVTYLIDEFGVESFQRLVGELAHGRTTDDALLLTYGFDIPQLEARWAADDRRPPAPRPGSRARGSPWTNFSSVIIGALALVVMSSMIVRYAVRKLRPAPASEDGLQPWEDPDLLDDDWPRS